MSYHEGVAKEVDVLEQLAEWRNLLNNFLGQIKAREITPTIQSIIDDIEYALFYNPEEKVKALQNIIKGIAKSEPIDYDSYSKCTYCGGGMSLTRSKKAPLQDHKPDCPWLKAREELE